MEIEGKIIEDLGIRSGVSARTGESWRMASYVIETESMYPRRMMFSVSDGRNGRIAQLNIRVGKRMRIYFEIAASKTSDGRWYNQINAFGAKDLDAKAPEAHQDAAAPSPVPEGHQVSLQMPPAEPAPAPSNEAVPNDMPF